MAIGVLWNRAKSNLRIKLTLTEWALLVMLGFMTVSTFLSVDFSSALGGAPRRYEGLWAWFIYCILFFMAYLLTPRDQYKRILGALVAGGVICSIYGILQHFLLDFLPRHPSFIGYVRSYSFFDNPNFFGTYLVIILAVSFSLYMAARDKVRSVLLYPAPMLVFAALIYTETRGAWIGSAAGLAAFSYLTRGKLNRKRFLLGLSGFIIVSALIALEKGNHISRAISVVQEPIRAVAGDIYAGTWRLFIWKTSLPLIKDYFWFGSGLDTFSRVFNGASIHSPQNAHNIYLQLAVTAGVPAMLAYVVGTVAALNKFYHSVITLRDDNEQIIQYGILSACIGYMVQTFFNVSVIVVAPFFWLLLGMGRKLSTAQD